MNCSKCDAFYSYDNYLRETVPSALLQFFQEHEETKYNVVYKFLAYAQVRIHDVKV